MNPYIREDFYLKPSKSEKFKQQHADVYGNKTTYRLFTFLFWKTLSFNTVSIFMLPRKSSESYCSINQNTLFYNAWT